MYEKYLEIDAEYRRIEAEREALRKEILVDMLKNGEVLKSLGNGVLVVAKKVKWHYSEKLEEKRQKLKIDEVTEQEKGIAEREENPYLQFKI